MAEFWIDKRNDSAGNGTEGDPYKEITDVCNSGFTGVDPVINIVPGSGPYFPSDLTYLDQGNLYMNHRHGGTVTWNFNRNIVTNETNLSDREIYEWHPSVVDGLFYCTKLGHAEPGFATAVVSGIVSGAWDAKSTSLFGAYPQVTDVPHPKKWGYGDRDSLGFDTVYARGIDLDDPNDSVLVSRYNTRLIALNLINATDAMHVFNDITLRGGGQYSVSGSTLAKTVFNRALFENNDQRAVQLAGPGQYNYCSFINCGHEAFRSSDADQEAYNCFFENVHTITKLTAVDSTTTITVRNAKTKNLMAGAFQHDSAGQSLVEDHNQFHLDPYTSHGGQAIGFTTATRQWTQTDATDLPASTDTALATSVAPDSIQDGIGAIVSGIHDQPGPATDIDGKPVLFQPDMGPYDGRTTEIITEADWTPARWAAREGATVMINGGGHVNLSALGTENENITCKLSGSVEITQFTPAGSNTKLKAVQQAQRVLNLSGGGGILE
ncbi:MAG: hypothetical protein JEZ12_15930 [Desulfobacterium sp.]|nr:hypothetical protein [Desulfobacterium sp.]